MACPVSRADEALGPGQNNRTVALSHVTVSMEVKPIMDDEHTIALKNKVAELKERMSQMYAHSFADASKSKAFEAEFSLFLKSCEDARRERDRSITLQHYAVLSGLTVMIAASVSSIFVFSVHVLFGLLILLGFGFIGCGFLFLLLVGEIRMQRAEDFCADVEAYFRDQRWSAETDQKPGLQVMPMWEAYRRQWNGDVFADGPYRSKALYAPFRIAISVIDLMALVYIVLHFALSHMPSPWPFFVICTVVWMMSVSAQMLLVQTIISKVDYRIKKTEVGGQGRIEPVDVGLYPASWLNILKLFLLLDIVFPAKPVTRGSTGRM